MHTTASDGDLGPEELVGRCAAAGLGAIAVTDHNSTVHVPRARAECDRLGLELIPACEISTRWRGREHHLLAYFAPLDDALFQGRIEAVRRADLERSRRWVENAAGHGFAITWEAVEAAVGADRVPPFAVIRRLLLEGAAGDARLEPCAAAPHRLFGEWFAPGRPVATDPPWQPELPEAIAWVRQVGGVPVLAHPGATLGDIDPEDAFGTLRDEGLGGVEAWTTWHRPETSERLAAVAGAAGLEITAGADFHGPTVKPFVTAPGQVTHNGPEVLEGLQRALV
jgi:predicted metal-dependent phosphoesterase TrpH